MNEVLLRNMKMMKNYLLHRPLIVILYLQNVCHLPINNSDTIKILTFNIEVLSKDF